MDDKKKINHRSNNKNGLHMYKIITLVLLMSANIVLAKDLAPRPWQHPKVSEKIAKNVLYLPITAPEIKAIPIKNSAEELVDLLKVDNPRIKSLAIINKDYCPAYDGYSKVRLGLYHRLVKMLDYLPQDVGIAFCEGLRPLAKQKEYFDKKFKELLKELKNPEKAYVEASKFVSPFIDNTPTHCTGAAIDVTLFRIKDSKYKPLEMGKFDTIFGENPQEETFSNNTDQRERENRLILLNAAAKAGLASYGFEWWHYSYGDRMWAYVKGEKHAIYGLAVPKDDPILKITKETYFEEMSK